MSRTFSSILYRLMVGVGGGAPSLDPSLPLSKKHDIRLGDVVVSSPYDSASGVIQYDFGKAIRNKRLQRIGALEAPLLQLLSAVQKLSASHESSGHQILASVDRIIDLNPRLRKNYQRPPASMDILFQSSFTHADDTQTCAELCASRSHKIIRRSQHGADEDDPMIHYGLIASGSGLIKNAELRDRIAQTEGILCFEMETAGLMNHFPCLVIRGICDYFDTYKNDMWQGYAAATAAAYAKELISILPRGIRAEKPHTPTLNPSNPQNERLRSTSSNSKSEPSQANRIQPLPGKAIFVKDAIGRNWIPPEPLKTGRRPRSSYMLPITFEAGQKVSNLTKYSTTETAVVLDDDLLWEVPKESISTWIPGPLQ